MSISNIGVSSTPKSEAKQQGLAVEIVDSEALEFRHALRGAMLIAAFAVGLMLLGWMAFYFLIFMARGYVG